MADVSKANARWWIVVPAYNEGRWIGQVIDALGAQSDLDFRLVVVDNASTDDTADAARAAFARNPGLHGEVLHEAEKGTGCAADTGFRHAIANGAEIVFRTDADCLPAPTWFATLRDAMEADALDAASGPLRVRTDDVDLSMSQRCITRLGGWLVPRIAPYLKTNKGPEYLVPYIMLPGPNVGIRAAAYETSGGYVRRSFDATFLDKDMANALRRVTPRIRHIPAAIVHASERRTHAFGTVGTIRWLLHREGHQGETDIR